MLLIIILKILFFFFLEFIDNREDESEDVRGSNRDTRRLAMELDRQALEAENLDAEELALKMTQRYGRRRDQIGQLKSTIPSQFTAGVNQPNLFVVRCKVGTIFFFFLRYCFI